MRLFFVSVLTAALVSVPAALAATPTQLKAMAGPVTSALQTHETALAASSTGKPLVACWTSYGSALPIIQCVTYTLKPQANTKPMRFPTELRYVSRATEAYWAGGACPLDGCQTGSQCIYRVGVTLGLNLTPDGPLQLLNVCAKGWTKAIPA